MEEKDESQEEKPVLPPNSAKILQSSSQIQVDTTSQNSSKATEVSGSSTPTSDQEGDIISTIPSLRRKAPSSPITPPAPSKKLKIRSVGSSKKEKNEDHTAPPPPESLPGAPLQSFENRISTSQSLKRLNTSSGPSEDLSTDLIHCFKVMRMEVPNSLDDGASSSEQVGTPCRVSITTQEESVQTTPPNNQSSISHFGAFQLSREDTEVLGMAPMMQRSYSEQSADSSPIPASSPSGSSSEHIGSLAHSSTPDEKQEITPADQCDEKLWPTPTSCRRVLFSIDLASVRDKLLEKQCKIQEQSPSSLCTSPKTDEPEASSRIGDDSCLGTSSLDQEDESKNSDDSESLGEWAY